MDQTIQVNFNRLMPLFPLKESVLLPHGVQHLHIFEERYRQMVEDTLDGAGQIAMASFAEHAAHTSLDATPALRSAVCVGQILQHHRFDDGRFNIVLLGVCRARVVEVDEPDGDRMYRLARLELHERTSDEVELEHIRMRLQTLIRRPEVSSVRGLTKIGQLFDREDVPTSALVELVASALVERPDVRYALLAEADVRARASIVDAELRHIDRLLRAAQPQLEVDWPKGQSWN